MNRLREKTTATLLIAIFMISTLAIAVNAGTIYEVEIVKTADRLVALQCTDGGWAWIITGETEPSDPPGSHNLYGVTALGLIDAYRITGDGSYYDAAQLTADHLKGLTRAGDSFTFQTFDYRFLVEFSAISDDPSYKAHAISEWDWVKINVADYYADGNQDFIYNFWYSVALGYDSHGFGAWQAADAGLAALAMDDESWAENMAIVLADNIDDMADEDGYRFIGWGHALELLHAIDPTGYASQITSIIDDLEASQLEDGHWDGLQQEGGAQDTAYVVMGLLAVGRSDLAKKGTDWLVANQEANGGWINGEEYSESDSEALQALCCARTLMTKADFVPGKGKGLDKPLPNENFAKGRNK